MRQHLRDIFILPLCSQNLDPAVNLFDHRFNSLGRFLSCSETQIQPVSLAEKLILASPKVLSRSRSRPAWVLLIVQKKYTSSRLMLLEFSLVISSRLSRVYLSIDFSSCINCCDRIKIILSLSGFV